MKLLATLPFYMLFSVSFAQQLHFDPAFPGNVGPNAAVFCVQAQPDDRVILAGDFTHFAGLPAQRIVRIWPNGQRDTTFQMGTGFSGRVNDMRLMANGSMYLGGIFETYDGMASKNIVRLLSNGQRDSSFSIGTGLNNEVLGLEALNDGSVLVGGFFSQFRGLPVTQPLKILPNGQRDTTFNLGGTGVSGLIEVIREQPDGKILVAGSITQYNGQPVGRGVIRLLPNGQRDTTFNTGTGLSSGLFRAMELYDDGRIMVAGNFSNFNGTPVQRLIRLHSNGQLDTAFLINTPFNATILSIVVRKNGNILAFGNYSQIIGQLPHAIAEYSPTGILLTQPGPCIEMNSIAQDAVELSDSSILLGGSFTVGGGANRQRIGRLVNFTGVGPGPPVVVASQTVICPGATVTLTATSTLPPNSQFLWYVGGCRRTVVGSGTSLSIQPNSTTTYYVSIETACAASGICDTITIVVNDTTPPTPQQNSLPLVQAYCAVNLIPPTALSGCGQILTGSANGPTTFTTPGSYQVQWTYTDAFGNSSSQSQQLQIDTIDVRVNHVYFDFEALNTAASAYQWLDCSDGMRAIAGANARTFNSGGPGVFAVAITQDGCTDTSACYTILSNAVEQALWKGLQLFPNPAKEHVTVVFDQSLVLQLRDLHGRLLYAYETSGGWEQLQLPPLSPGMYSWEIQQGNHRLYRRQVVY